MMQLSFQRRHAGVSLLVIALLPALPAALSAQDRLPRMPGYEQFTKMNPLLAQSVRSGALPANQLQWNADGTALEYTFDGTRHRLELPSGRSTVVPSEATTADPAAARGGRGGVGTGRGGGRGGTTGAAPERGRQFESAIAPVNPNLMAFHRDRNLWIGDSNANNAVAVTTDGSAEKRVKYGTASWVYGEELNQTTAMWWSPDAKKLAFYRFDESKVPDYFLQLGQTQWMSTMDAEAYPKAGSTNPSVELFVYDVATKQKVQIDARNGEPLSDDVVGHYVYNIRWSPKGGRELLLNRTNRRQNIMEFCACSPETGKCRVIVREEWPTGWVENSPAMRYLADSSRFIWESERNGFNNFYLYDLAGKFHGAITNNQFEVGQVVRVDETGNQLWYMARDGDNFMKQQLHRVGLDGKGDVRLTDPAFNHAVTLSPTGAFFADVYQTHNQPPATRVIDASGKILGELARSNLSRFDSIGFKKREMFTYTAADGRTKLYGMISFPSNFDPTKKYPVLVPVYGGPASGSNTPTENWATPSGTTEYGFIVVNLGSRAVPGMGKRTLDALYLKLGQTEIDDMAEGIKALWSRSYIDRNRVGIYGTSYGGYTAAMEILKHPDVFQAAAAQSSVTDWRHYDTIYTERYMWTPQGNKAGYDAGSAMPLAANLKGRLLIYYGTADNNVHPNNSMQLIQALQRAGKSFEVQVGPDQGHTAVNNARMMEFFIENLVIRPAGG